MGVEWLQERAKAFKKSWDKGRLALGTANLFTQQPQFAAACTVPGTIVGAVALQVGERLLIERNDDHYVARRDFAVVARLTTLHDSVREALDRSSGIGTGTVECVHEIAGIVEISIC
jgi:hypothetical protein